MSLRSGSPQSFSKDQLISHASPSAIQTAEEKILFDTYQKLSESSARHQFSHSVFSRTTTDLDLYALSVLDPKIREINRKMKKIEDDPALEDFFKRVLQRLSDPETDSTISYEQEMLDRAKAVLKRGTVPSNDLLYYDELWKNDSPAFWTQAKLQWRSRNPESIRISTFGYFSPAYFEEYCSYLERMTSLMTEQPSLAEMKRRLLRAQHISEDECCVIDILSKYDRYFSFF